MRPHEDRQMAAGAAQELRDPLGLRRLEAVEPGYDGWAEIESALRADRDRGRNFRRTGAWLGVAASLVVAAGAGLHFVRESAGPAAPATRFAAPSGAPAPMAGQDDVAAMIGLSRSMEQQLRRWRSETAAMPAAAAMYVAELEDLIALVDEQLTAQPASLDLWGQRVNLMLDLAQIYQQHWQADFGRVAAL